MTAGGTSPEIALDQISGLNSAILDQLDRLATRATTVLFAALSAFGLLFGYAYKATAPHLVGGIISGGLLVLSATFAILSFRSRGFIFVGEPGHFEGKLDLPPEDFARHLVNLHEAAWTTNLASLDSRASCLDASMWLLLAGALAFVVGVVVF